MIVVINMIPIGGSRNPNITAVPHPNPIMVVAHPIAVLKSWIRKSAIPALAIGIAFPLTPNNRQIGSIADIEIRGDAVMKN